MRRWRHLLEYAALRSILGLFALPPRVMARGLGRALGRLIHRLGIRRAVVEENLAIAFPDRPAPDRAALGRRCYEHFGAVLVDTVDFHRWSDAEIIERVQLFGEENLRTAINRGCGVVVATAHLGCYDVVGARMALAGFPLQVVYQGVRNPYVGKYITRIRQTRGVGLIRRGIQFRAAFAALKQGLAVAILADQDAGPRGLFVPFFGRSASTLAGPAEFALRTGAVLLPAFTPLIDGRYAAVFEEPIPPSDIETMMTAWNGRLEAMIRRYPDQYFWLHRRWKSVKEK
jgi:KDO2-lipid IV(A) lauroyltransferase